MTPRDKLEELGYTPEEIDKIRDSGITFDVKALRELGMRYIGNGEDAKGLELIQTSLYFADYWSEKVADLTGRNIAFSEAANRWYDEATGYPVKDPYTDIRFDEYQFEQRLINLFGE
jgi:hypothetical protein